MNDGKKFYLDSEDKSMSKIVPMHERPSKSRSNCAKHPHATWEYFNHSLCSYCGEYKCLLSPAYFGEIPRKGEGVTDKCWLVVF